MICNCCSFSFCANQKANLSNIQNNNFREMYKFRNDRRSGCDSPQTEEERSRPATPQAEKRGLAETGTGVGEGEGSGRKKKKTPQPKKTTKSTAKKTPRKTTKSTTKKTPQPKKTTKSKETARPNETIKPSELVEKVNKSLTSPSSSSSDDSDDSVLSLQ